MEDSKYKLSIIIPMYNAEKYIAGCLDSILNSDLQKGEYEVIIINDGSIDQGPNIAREYCSKCDDFVYLSQENQGQSVARNYGIQTARGEYIWCVDADDLVAKELSLIIRKLDQDKVDSLITMIVVVDEKMHELHSDTHYMMEYDKIIKGRDVFFLNYPIGSVCGNFIRRKFLLRNRLSFVPGIMQQDVEFSNRLFANAEKVMFANITSYIYVKRPNSVTMSKDLERRKKYLLDTVRIIQSLIELSKKKSQDDCELSKQLQDKSDGVLFGLVLTLYKNRGKWKENGINREVIEELKNQHLYPLRYKNFPLKRKIGSLLLNFEKMLY